MKWLLTTMPIKPIKVFEFIFIDDQIKKEWDHASDISWCPGSGVQCFKGKHILTSMLSQVRGLELSSNVCFLCKAQWHFPDTT